MIVKSQGQGWFADFLVDGILVKTVDVFTYHCTKCGQICPHTQAVSQYVIDHMHGEYQRLC